MAALVQKRLQTLKEFSSLEFPADQAQYYQGGIICLDTTTGRATKGAVSTTLVPLGTAREDRAIAANGDPLLVRLDKPIRAQWFANSVAEAVTTADLLQLCYIEDDQTVAQTSDGGTLSAAGLVWAVDAVKGVLVEFVR